MMKRTIGWAPPDFPIMPRATNELYNSIQGANRTRFARNSTPPRHVDQIGLFHFARRDENQVTPQAMKSAVAYAEVLLPMFYLDKMPCVTCYSNLLLCSKYNKASDATRSCAAIVRHARRIRRHHVTEKEDRIVWRVESDDGSAVIYFEMIVDGALDKGTSQSVDLCMVIFTAADRAASVQLYSIDLGGSGTITDVWYGPLYIGAEQRISREIARTAPYDQGALRPNIVTTMEAGLRGYRNSLETIEPTEIVHQSYEVDIYKAMIRYYEGEKIGPMSISGFDNLPWPDKWAESQEKRREAKRSMMMDENPPLVDMTTKELSFISGYVNKREYFHGGVVDMVEIMKYPRYGTVLRYPFIDSDGTRCVCFTDVVMEEEYDRMSVLVTVDCPDDDNYGRAPFFGAEFTNLRNFTGFENLVAINVQYLQFSLKEMPKCKDDIRKFFPPMFQTWETTLNEIWKLLALHIVIHDRPQRTRMVRIEKRNETPHAPREKKDDKPDYIVKRILKPIKEAKEYVRKMQESGAEERGECIYLMKSWTRKGYYRRRPHSETYIWIPETTYKRNPELLEKGKKELHLKL